MTGRFAWSGLFCADEPSNRYDTAQIVAGSYRLFQIAAAIFRRLKAMQAGQVNLPCLPNLQRDARWSRQSHVDEVCDD